MLFRYLFQEFKYLDHSFEQDSNESETARHVRLLLARHQQQHHQLKQLQRQGVAMNQTPFLVDGVQSDSNGSDDQFSSALPGDSYPDTDRHLASTEVDSNITDDEEVILMQRLSQSQARMEQIKRMLVNQRGFIVQALRLMAEGGRSGAPGQASSDDSNADPDERDRTLGSSVKHVAERLDPDVQDLESESSEVSHKNEKKLCPMCEAAFPTDVDEDEFELHVIEHFNYDEQDTLKYVGPDEGEVISQ